MHWSEKPVPGSPLYNRDDTTLAPEPETVEDVNRELKTLKNQLEQL